jgi:hypothetical protein
MPSSLRTFFQPASYNDSVSHTDSILTHIFSWTLLFGYILYPSYFPQINTRDEYAGCIEYEEYWDCPEVYDDPPLSTIQISPQFYACALACCIGLLGWLYLWWKYQRNHQWLINWIFYPALANSLAGVWSSISKVVTAPEGQYSMALEVAMVAPSVGSAIVVGLGLWYHVVVFGKRKREQEVAPVALEKEREREEKNQERGFDLKC